jgi:RimJ/RimL family protein N-acetyltransferase
MENDLFQSNLVRLSAEDPQTMAEAFSRWGGDTEYIRLLDNDPPRTWSVKKWKEWLEKELEKEPPVEFFFTIRVREDDRLIGFVGLFGLDWNQGNAWVGIGLGEREYWGNGYGTEAMRLALGYAFTELNLRRVTLGVFEYNPRARRSYEKAGFKVEGRLRGALNREGRRWDIFEMGILRQEWLESIA